MSDPSVGEYNSWLAQRPLFAAIIIALLFWISTLWSAVSTGLVAIALLFVTLALISQIIIPLFLGLPNGFRSMPDYRRDIRLVGSSNLGQDFYLGVGTAIFLLGSLIIPNILSGETIFDFNRFTIFHFFQGINHGLWEEIFFRGVILVLLMRAVPQKWGGILAAGVLFTIVHADPAHYPRLILMGFLWGYLTVATGSLTAAVISHILYDVCSVFLAPSLTSDQMTGWLVAWTFFVAIACFISIVVIHRSTKEPLSYLNRL